MTSKQSVSRNRGSGMLGAAVAGIASCAGSTIGQMPEPPLLGPTALRADAGDCRAYLRWNLQIEDPRIVGWEILQLHPTETLEAEKPITAPHHVVRGLTNNVVYQFAVVGIARDGRRTQMSNSVRVKPHEVGQARLRRYEAPCHRRVGLHECRLGSPSGRDSFEPVEVTFPDGQQLVYDQRHRPVDWVTRDGEHLLYPGRFGNAIDLGRFEHDGLPRVIGPDAANTDRPYPQAGTKHPYITSPHTLSLGGKVQPHWFGVEVDGNRVTFHYAMPIAALGSDARTFVEFWETWWPIERERWGTEYHGLARLIEVKVPDPLRSGYQVMINNGFGPAGGMNEDVVAYDSGFRHPAVEVVDFSDPDSNTFMRFHHAKFPRTGNRYHPNQDCFQSHPLIFLEWDRPDSSGTLTVSLRSMYYHAHQMPGSYVEQGHPGVWPNIAWDMHIAGHRTAVDTVEYLYSGDTATQPLPQRYLNARWETLYTVADRMGVQTSLGGARKFQRAPHIANKGGIEPFLEYAAEFYQGSGIDAVGMYHDQWLANPAIGDPRHRRDPDFGRNPELTQVNRKLKQMGLSPGFWFRPDYLKTGYATALMRSIPAFEPYYHTHGARDRQIPDPTAYLQEHGIPEIREYPHRIRRTADGTFPERPAYGWVPISMASDWMDQVIWPALWTGSELGFEWLLQDGGQGGFEGVDYGPMLRGEVDTALPMQPYWWKLFRWYEHLDLKLIGECCAGFPGGYTNLGGDGDEHLIWMLHASTYAGDFEQPEQQHRLHQLYNTTMGNRPSGQIAAVERFASNFYQDHDPPLWIELINLRQADEPVTVSTRLKQGPADGRTDGGMGENLGDELDFKPWVWDQVIWHYPDGQSVVYPAFDDINWAEWSGERTVDRGLHATRR